MPLKGIPSDRDDRILHEIVSRREDFLRYLWLLLYEGEYPFGAPGAGVGFKNMFGRGQDIFLNEEMPLFEELVRAYSRDPDKIKRVSKLIEDICKTEEGERILPKEFKELWATFKEIKFK